MPGFAAKKQERETEKCDERKQCYHSFENEDIKTEYIDNRHEQHWKNKGKMAVWRIADQIDVSVSLAGSE
jgi:hypothetical protein